MVLAVAAGWWGGRHVQRWRDAGQPQIFYQQYFEPAVSIACGRGFESAAAMPAPVEAFLMQRIDSFNCAQLPLDLRPNPDHAVYQYAWFYLMWMIGLFWKVFGVSWSGLVPLFGALFALVIVLAYAIFRLAVPPWAAFPAAAALTISTLHLQNLPHLRDYAKAPFVLALFLIIFVIAKSASTPRRLLVLAAIYGLVLGIGYGFRTDLLANILPFIVTVAVFTPGFHFRDVAMKAAALAVAAAVFVTVAWPVISYVRNQGGCQWHVVLLGLEHNYNDNLGVTPSYYQWLTRYSDEYVLTMVNSFIVRTDGTPPVPFCTPAYDAASGKYLAKIAAAFPADMLTRAYASILRVTDLPFNLWGVSPDTAVERSRLGQILVYVVGTSRLAVAFMILALAATSWRLGLYAAFVVSYIASYPMLQFAHRHFFHLEFLGWWALAFVSFCSVRVVLWAAGRAGAPWPLPPSAALRRCGAFAVVLLVIVVLPVPIVRAYHDRLVQELTATILSAPRVSVVPTGSSSASELAIDIADVESDSVGTVYLDVRVDLSACPSGVPLRLVYDPSNPFYDFSVTIQPQPRDIVVERYLTPVFRGFRGLSTGDAPASCIAGIERLASARDIPLLPTYTLPERWQEIPPHQRVGWTALRVWRFGG